MDLEIVKKHWTLIEMVAKHDYVPNGSNGQILELKNHYHGHVDLWCGACIVNMCKRLHLEWKDKV